MLAVALALWGAQEFGTTYRPGFLDDWGKFGATDDDEPELQRLSRR